MFKTQTLFIITAFLISLANYLFFKSTIDLNFYDTYYVITQKFLAEFIALVCILNFVIYTGFARYKNPLQTRLGLVHYVLTVFPFLTLLFKPTDQINTLTILAMIAAVLFISGQVILLINMIRTVKKSNN